MNKDRATHGAALYSLPELFLACWITWLVMSAVRLPDRGVKRTGTQ
jgi:hypothetical protein